jgi:SAM-dependent methyltransferase
MVEEYWNNRFLKEEKIWGAIPSKTAFIALELFQEYEIKSILIPGAGYGRNARLFTENSFKLTGIEISDKAIEIAQQFDPKLRMLKGDVVNMPFNDEFYDAIYCFNVLHLFNYEMRILFLKKCATHLNMGGLMFFVVFSEKEPSYGKGKLTECNTFESKPGRPVHYFTEDDLFDHFKEFSRIASGLVVDEENHGEEGKHMHVLRYICCQKKNN